MYLEFFGKPFVVLHSQVAAHELLEKRGAKYSDRPRMVTITDMCVLCVRALLKQTRIPIVTLWARLGWDPSATTRPYGPSLTKQRKWIHRIFGEGSTLKGLDSLKQRETCILLTSLMATPTDLVLHVKRSAPSLVRGLTEHSLVGLILFQVYRRYRPRSYLWPPHHLFGRRVRDADVSCDGGDYGNRSSRRHAR